MEELLKNVKFGDKFCASNGRCAVYLYSKDDEFGKTYLNEADEEFPYSFIADVDGFYNFSANEIGETLVDSPMGCCGVKGENIFFIKNSVISN